MGFHETRSFEHVDKPEIGLGSEQRENLRKKCDNENFETKVKNRKPTGHGGLLRLKRSLLTILSMANVMKKRNLTIGYQERRNKYRALKQVPIIKLAGNWLEAAGFSTGDSVEVVIEQGLISVKVI